MLSEMVDIGTTGGLGAIVGVIGGGISKWFDLKKQRQDVELRVKLAEISAQEAESEREHALLMADKEQQAAQYEGMIQADISAGQALIESIKSDAKSTGIIIVDAIRGLMRPVITTVLMTLSIWLTYQLWRALGGLGGLPHEDLIAMFWYILKQMVFLTVLAVSWWFASRPSRLLDPAK